jgi:GrpB-like predicted nucleotidyltransferase (UPF0157 family)
METLRQRIQRVVAEHVELAPYDPRWPAMFEEEKRHLLACLPSGIIRRIEHFGSTAVPGLLAKPIIDILVEVSDLEATKLHVAPVLEAQGYDYFWRPTHGDDGPPFYAWFIKRDPGSGTRTHHIHMVESDFVTHWERLLFRDYLIRFPEVAEEYGRLKARLAEELSHDRIAYTRDKTEFIDEVTERAKRYFGKA